MAFVPAVDTAQVKLNYRLHGQVVQNVLYVRNATGWSTAELQALCVLVYTWFNDHLAGNVSTDLTLQSVFARDMTTEEAAGVEINAPAGSGGDVASPALPGNVALTVKHITGLSGRNRRGRTFVAGIPETSGSGNTVLDAVRDGVVDAFGELRDDLLGAGYEHVVASFFNGTALELQGNGETRRVPVPRATALITPVEQYTADTNLDSQRRRLNGRGV